MNSNNISGNLQHQHQHHHHHHHPKPCPSSRPHRQRSTSLLSDLSSSDTIDSGIDSVSASAVLHNNLSTSAVISDVVQWDRSGLRTVERDVWEDMLAIVKCQVLSVVSNEACDAYLLSESSMFVYPDRLILKTCGTTTLLNAVPRILEIAQQAADKAAAVAAASTTATMKKTSATAALNDGCDFYSDYGSCCYDGDGDDSGPSIPLPSPLPLPSSLSSCNHHHHPRNNNTNIINDTCVNLSTPSPTPLPSPTLGSSTPEPQQQPSPSPLSPTQGVLTGRPYAVLYSRKAFLFPDRQQYPHGRWGDEVAFLDGLFDKDGWDTAGYVVGRVNGDHWCLYVAAPGGDDDDVEVENTKESVTSAAFIAATHGSSLDDETLSEQSTARNGDVTLPIAVTNENGDANEDDDEGDVTLEIMMQELDPEVTKLFFRTEPELAEGLTAPLTSPGGYSFASDPMGGDSPYRKGERRVLNETGIANIYPNSIVDDFLFDPCGYSLNGLMGRHYYTIHVTPEDICSYASFETSIPAKYLRAVSASASSSSATPLVTTVCKTNFTTSDTNKNNTITSAAPIKPISSCSQLDKKPLDLKHDSTVASSRASEATLSAETMSLDTIIQRVVKCFRPGKFSATLFTHKNMTENGGVAVKHREHHLKRVEGFRHVDNISYELPFWNLEFAHYVKAHEKRM